MYILPLQQNNNCTNFKAGKLYLYTDFDHTFLPTNIPNLLTSSKDDILSLQNYYKNFNQFARKAGNKFKFCITTLRSIDEMDEVFRYVRKHKIPMPFPDILITEGGKYKYKRTFFDKIFPTTKQSAYRQGLIQHARSRWQHNNKSFDIIKLIHKCLKKDNFVITAGDGDADKQMLNIGTYVRDYFKYDWCMNYEPLTPSLKEIIERMQINDTLENVIANQMPIVSIVIQRDKYPGRFDELHNNLQKMVKVKEGNFFDGLKQAIELLTRFKAKQTGDMRARWYREKYAPLSKRVIKNARRYLG